MKTNFETMMDTGDIVEFRLWCQTCSVEDLVNAWTMACVRSRMDFGEYAFKMLNDRKIIKPSPFNT